MSERTTPAEVAAMLDAVRSFFTNYVVLPDPAYADAVALWVAHAHVITASFTTPRLIFRSPEKASGKTRALEVLNELVPNPRLVLNTTPAAIYRRLKDTQICLLFDEVDTVFHDKAGPVAQDLRAILNSGYRRGAMVDRCVDTGKKMRVESFPVFAAVALAAISNLPDTVESRSVIIPMRRRAPDEPVKSFRQRYVSVPAEELRRWLEEWADEVVDQLAEADPEMPDGLPDRSMELWEPLIAIADLAGEEWARRAREAAIFAVKGRVAEDQSLGVRLLADIQSVGVTSVTQTRVGVTGVAEVTHGWRLASVDLCARLNALEESPWGGWNDGRGINQRDLAKRLKPYGVEPRTVKLADGTTAKGYRQEDLADPFGRYLRSPSLDVTGVTNVTQDRIQVTEVTEVTDREGNGETRPRRCRVVCVDDGGHRSWQAVDEDGESLGLGLFNLRKTAIEGARRRHFEVVEGD